MVDKLHRALDLAKAGAWSQAAALLADSDGALERDLAALFGERQRREADLRHLRSTKCHEIANHLAIAVANLEAMADGALEITPTRLENIRDALRSAGNQLKDVPEPPASAERGIA